MAEREKGINSLLTRGDLCHVILWTGLLNGDNGSPLEMPGSADRSVQVSGTFGSGGNLRIEGSNDGSNFVVLSDPQGNALDITSASIKMVMEVTRYIRPRVTSGNGSTDLTVTMIVRRVTK